VNKAQFCRRLFKSPLMVHMTRDHVSPLLWNYGAVRWAGAPVRLWNNAGTYTFIWQEGQQVTAAHRGRNLLIPNGGWIKAPDPVAFERFCRELQVDIAQTPEERT